MARRVGGADESVRHLEFRILGPIEVVGRDGRQLRIGGRLEKMLLGTLAIAANHAVSTDALAEVLWGDAPPPSRNNSLQTYVSRLRAAIGRERIVSENHSYQLCVDEGELDALEFERLAKAADAGWTDPTERLSICTKALQLWRGTPFGDFADLDPFRLEVIRLEELKMSVLEARLGAEIALGHENLVTGTLEGLVQEYPYRERLWQLLIGALALTGRRVEALRSCEEVRSVLGELGLDPGPEIVRLEQAILLEDPQLRTQVTLQGNDEPVAS